MQTVERECPVCGRTYTANTNRLKHGRQTTCSRECSYKLRASELSSGITVYCRRCGKPMHTTASKQKKGFGVYCSRECQNPPIISVCAQCGREFRHSPSAKRKCCSVDCANKAKAENGGDATKAAWADPVKRKNIMDGIKRRSHDETWKSAAHFQRGKLHPRYKGNRRARQDASKYEYKNWHKMVLKSCNYTCQQCGKRGVRLEAHHIKPWAEHAELRFDVSNGIALCVDCHLSIHGHVHKPVTKTCLQCGKEFKPNKTPQKYCCRECHWKHMRK